MDEWNDGQRRPGPIADVVRPRATLPVPSAGERDFWRRAVAVERARLRRSRPAPFPFQPA